jgi:protein-tyrosine phosphatase
MDRRSSKILEFIKFTKHKSSGKSSGLISDSDVSEANSDANSEANSETSENRTVKVKSFSVSPFESIPEVTEVDFLEEIDELYETEEREMKEIKKMYDMEKKEEIEYNVEFRKLEKSEYADILAKEISVCEKKFFQNIPISQHTPITQNKHKKKNFFSQLKQSVKEEDEVDVEKMICQCCENKDEVELFLDNLMRVNFNQYFVDVIKKNLLEHIEFLYMSKNDLNYIDKSIFCLKQIIELDLSKNNLKKIPEDIGNLKNLVKINLSFNKLADLPYNFENLENLEIVNLELNDFRQIPPVIFKLKKIKVLYMSNNSEIISFPPKKYFESLSDFTLWIDNVPELLNEAKILMLPPNIKIKWNQIYPDKIFDFLFLSDIKSTFNKYVLDYHEITEVFSIGRELEVENFNDINYEKYDIDDDENQDINFAIINKIHKKILNKKKCLIHCQKGISRSTTIVLAYLMKYKNMRLYDAYEYVKNRREKICPNNGFFEQLVRYDVQLFGKAEERNLNELRKEN